MMKLSRRSIIISIMLVLCLPLIAVLTLTVPRDAYAEGIDASEQEEAPQLIINKYHG